MKKFDQWFNPYSFEHMLAYEHLCKEGTWPEGFVPAGMEMPLLWNVHIQSKMADAWLISVKREEIPGVTGKNGGKKGKRKSLIKEHQACCECAGWPTTEEMNK